jgi:hypothetical protein
VESELDEREQRVIVEIGNRLDAHPNLQATPVNLARREALRAQRAALTALASEGVISTGVIHELQAEVDEALQSDNALAVAGPVSANRASTA